jgi:hypothetical protein
VIQHSLDSHNRKNVLPLRKNMRAERWLFARKSAHRTSGEETRVSTRPIFRVIAI